MPAVQPITKLLQRIDRLSSQVRFARCASTLAVSALLVFGFAVAFMFIDARWTLPGYVRGVGLAVWLLVLGRQLLRIRSAFSGNADREAVAGAVEKEFPRLAERLTTAVELSEHREPANGSPVLIDEVLRETEVRVRRLELERAVPVSGARWWVAVATILIPLIVIPAVLQAKAGETIRRFFAPWYVPAKSIEYQLKVTSGSWAIKRGESAALTAYVEPTRPGAETPSALTAVIRVDGREERLAMVSDQPDVWHVKREAVDASFEYVIEAGPLTSDPNRVTVVVPPALASARVVIELPAYAAKNREPDPPIEGLGELAVLEHGKVSFQLKFAPVPAQAEMTFTAETKGDDDKDAPRTRHPLTIGTDGSTNWTFAPKSPGKLRLSAVGAQAIRAEFPEQPLRLIKDEAPKFPRVTGLGGPVRDIRPDDRIVVECAVTDDFSVESVVLEWKINEGDVQRTPVLPAVGGKPQYEGKLIFPLAGKVKAGDILQCRLVAADNRDIPEANLKPQTTYFPGDGFSAFRVASEAAPLAHQDILNAKAEVERRLNQIRDELKKEWRGVYALRNETKTAPKLAPGDMDRLRETREEVTRTGSKTEDLAKDIGVNPELGRLADQIRALAERPIRSAESSLGKARDTAKQIERNDQLESSENSLDKAVRSIDDLLALNDKIAKERMDKRRLEELAEKQRELAERAKNADPKDAAKLAEQQRAIEDELKKLQEQSDALREAIESARAERAKQLAAEAERLAKETRQLDQDIRQADSAKIAEKAAELKKQQDELAKRAADLAKRTEEAARTAQIRPATADQDARKASDALAKGNVDEAARAQEQAAQELDRLAKDLEEAVGRSRDGREAAKQLARLQDQLRKRMAEDAKSTPLDKLPDERRAALQKQQEAINKAAERLNVPKDNQQASLTRYDTLERLKRADQRLKEGDQARADAAMQDARNALERLAEQLPTPEQRTAKAREQVAELKRQQDALKKKADQAIKSAENRNADERAVQDEIGKELAESARRQAELAEQIRELDAPGQEPRKAKTAEQLRRAADDLTDGRPQDIAASQQSAQRALDRLEQALNGKKPVDEQIDELAKQQRKLADDARRNARDRDPQAQLDQLRRQADIAKEIERASIPEAPSAQADALDSAKKAAAAATQPQQKEQFAEQAGDAADKLERLARQLDGNSSAERTVDQLAKKQRESADKLAGKKDAAQANEARQQAQKALDELKNTRTGDSAQQAKRDAQDALQRAAQSTSPDQAQKNQQAAADALKDLADKLTRNNQARNQAPKQDPAEDTADRLAKKQKELAEQTKRAAQAAKENPGAAGEKAKQESAEQLGKQQEQLNRRADQSAGRSGDRERQEARNAMNQAQNALKQGDLDGASKKQDEAADALDRLARKEQEQAERDQAEKNTGLPNREQAQEARQLAEQQRQLRDQSMQAGRDASARPDAQAERQLQEAAEQQKALAQQAERQARQTEERQGPNSAQAKSARQAADAAKQAAEQSANGNPQAAAQSAQQAAQAMQRAAEGAKGTEAGNQAAQMAKQQQDLADKLGKASQQPGAGQGRQQARQQELQNAADKLGEQLEAMSREASKGSKESKGAADDAKRAGNEMRSARDASDRGNRDEATRNRQQAAQSLENAAKQAGMAGGGEPQAGQPSGQGQDGQPQAGQSVRDAGRQMNQAGQQLGNGKPGEAQGSMSQAADSLQRAADQLGGKPQGNRPGNPNGSTDPGGNTGGPGGALDLSKMDPEIAKYSGKSWGELPGEIKTKIISDMKARYGEDYARNIKLYFEQIAERK